MSSAAGKDTPPSPQPRLSGVPRDVPSPWPTAPRSAPCLETTCRTLAPPNVFCHINVGTPRARLSISAQHRHQSGVHSQLGAVEQATHRPTPQHGNSSKRLGATMSMSWILTFVVINTSSTLHRETAPPPPQHMLHGGGHWDRVDGRLDEGRGSHKRRSGRTRNTCESKLDWRVTGQHVKGTLASGPL